MDSEQPTRGFYVIRRVRALTPHDAEQQAIAALQTEERYRSIAHSQKHGRVELESITELSWFTTHFSREPRGFIFYADENTA